MYDVHTVQLVDPEDNEIDHILETSLPWSDTSSEKDGNTSDTRSEEGPKFEPLFPWCDSQPDDDNNNHEKREAEKNHKIQPPSRSLDERKNAVVVEKKRSAGGVPRKWITLLILVLLLCAVPTLLGVLLPKQEEDEENDDISPAPSLAPTQITASPTITFISPAPAVANTAPKFFLSIILVFDDYAEEIGWSLTNRDTGRLVEEVTVTSYPHGLKEGTHQVPVERDASYTFQIRDSSGDGLCCETPGSYSIVYEGILLAFGEGNWGLEDTKQFTVW
jgi:hypothetical protein